MSFLFDWDLDRPLRENLANSLYFDWGGTFSITEHRDPDKPGYVGITYRQWIVGPVLVRRVIYQWPDWDDRDQQRHHSGRLAASVGRTREVSRRGICYGAVVCIL